MKGSKARGRLASRQAAHVKTSNETKVKLRWESGGYKRPGSLKKDYPRGRKRSHAA
jgi:hypothetical protein